MCGIHKIKYVVPVSTVHTYCMYLQSKIDGDFEVNALPTVTHQVSVQCVPGIQ